MCQVTEVFLFHKNLQKLHRGEGFFISFQLSFSCPVIKSRYRYSRCVRSSHLLPVIVVLVLCV